MKVLFSSFSKNSHTAWFDSQTITSQLHRIGINRTIRKFCSAAYQLKLLELNLAVYKTLIRCFITSSPAANFRLFGTDCGNAENGIKAQFDLAKRTED